jgi:hypothetical protein
MARLKKPSIIVHSQVVTPFSHLTRSSTTAYSDERIYRCDVPGVVSTLSSAQRDLITSTDIGGIGLAVT